MTIGRSNLNFEKIQEKYILPKINIGDPAQCWLWGGRIDKHNRAKFYYPSSEVGKSASGDARRFLFAVEKEIPRSHMLIPGCNQIRCVNPSHQRIVSVRVKQPLKRKKRRPKQACKRGHKFTSENTILKRCGQKRSCRKCQRASEKRFHDKRKLLDWHKFGELVGSAELSTKLSRLPKKYYVYHLLDPSSNEVFYVGKGCGDRVFQHEREVGCGFNANQAKGKRILAILAQGDSVEFRIIKQNISEPYALWLERLEIDRLGIANLTNKVSGIIPNKYRKLIA